MVESTIGLLSGQPGKRYCECEVVAEATVLG